MSTGPRTFFLDLPQSIAGVYLWFHTSLPKPAGSQTAEPQPAVLLILDDHSYKVEAIL